ncbi:MAG: DUF4491 family protein [Prevotellaceae bacterium]|jgi:hypothetical protein|nr:DUF4491 family protein [Prevotellaceae bacterium]
MEQFSGIIVGFSLFVIIYISRWACIKGEYYFTKKFWIVFLIAGITGISISLFLENIIISSISGIFGFVSLWGIGETVKQEERVKKGWFPERQKNHKKFLQ